MLSGKTTSRRYRVLIAGLLSWYCFTPLYAQYWNPEIGALLTYTRAAQYVEVQSGPFAWQTRPINYGFDFSNRILLPKRFFVGLGIRYQQFRTTITAFNQIAILQDDPPPFTWEKRYELFTVPLCMGRLFDAGRKGITLLPWIGGSVGILTTSYARADVYKALKKDPDNLDLIYMGDGDSAKQVPTYRFTSLDFGITGEHRAFPRWCIGLLGSIQLNRPAPYHYGRFAGNLNTGEYYAYSMNHSQRFINCTMRLSCKLGNLKKRAQRRRCSTDCPAPVN